MGLLYIMPASKDEIEHVIIKETSSGRQLHLHSYGLPMMFWGYFLGIIGLEFAMYLSVSSIIEKLFNSPEALDKALVIGCSVVMVSLPIFTLGMLFFQKVIIRGENSIQIKFKVFGLTVRNKLYQFKPNDDHLEVKHLLESPNMAKIRKDPTTRAFENQGHYILTLWSKNKPYFIDRHTRKQDLQKLADLLINFS